METNEAPLDRKARIVIGVLVTSLAFWGPETPWAYIGLIPLLTGVIGFCPLYKIFGFSTCPLVLKK